ncbi:hypothetical protein EOD39_6995 [Acipenser ruthenus]|uniref:Biogenesis of lysosome-related organelles complex 1 subunit 2 n=1 Tax=Acipenser ruthenus TaxID=7906 RepID=A0A444U8E1_ACIRT|nr:hypothetical protein EOD39_6995 [Acipenser ruthenus]
METSINNSSAGQALGPNSATDTAIFGQIPGSDPGTDADLYMPVPKKPGTNNESGVETAEEAVEPAEPDVNELCRDMFDKMAVFLQGELTATCEDYKLVENMNKLTSLKYMEMKDISINISRNLKDLNQKYAGLQPYLDQINQIEEQVTALEQAAYKLDTYSKKLDMWRWKTVGKLWAGGQDSCPPPLDEAKKQVEAGEEEEEVNSDAQQGRSESRLLIEPVEMIFEMTAIKCSRLSNAFPPMLMSAGMHQPNSKCTARIRRNILLSSLSDTEYKKETGLQTCLFQFVMARSAYPIPPINPDGVNAPTNPIPPNNPDGNNAPTNLIPPNNPDGDDAPTHPIPPNNPDGDNAPTHPIPPNNPDVDNAPTHPIPPNNPDGDNAPTHPIPPNNPDGDNTVLKVFETMPLSRKLETVVI